MDPKTLPLVLVLVAYLSGHLALAALAPNIGVYYKGSNNRFPDSDVSDLLKKCGIPRLLLDAFLRVSGFPDQLLSVHADDMEVQSIAEDSSYAIDWVETKYLPFNNIVDIVLGDGTTGIIPGPRGKLIVPAMRILRTTLDNTTKPHVRLSVSISDYALENTFPPSRSTFTNQSIDVMIELVQYINSLPPRQRPSLYVNLYPYYAYASDPSHISLDFAIFQDKEGFMDGNLKYMNLFDAMFDSYVWALEKIGGGNISLTVGQTGWPWDGNGNITTPQLAAAYVQNLYGHIVNNRGTPKAPYGFGEVYVYSLFTNPFNREKPLLEFSMFDDHMRQVYASPLCQ